MICPDINLLLYAIFKTYPQHQKTKVWWDGALSSSQFVKIGHVVILGFIRISTNPRVFSIPLTTDAHIAALAADYGLVIHSNDSDFARFPNVKWVNPL